MNQLHLGDCFDVLRQDIENESIDLIYIDPPFNSKRNYNIFFDDKDIKAQRIAFVDTWSLKNTQDSLLELQSFKTEKLYKLLMTYSEIAPFAFPYLVMMGLRIVELHRVLKSTGSFYLHCDPNMSHYLKTVCDLIFGRDNFRNEIVWCYSTGGRSKKYFAKKHDIIFFYAKDLKKNKFNPLEEKAYIPTLKGRIFAIEKLNAKIDKDGCPKCSQKGGFFHMSGMKDVWEIKSLFRNSKERLGYPTQKPLALLERIIKASSNEGDVVLDAFCGCGTTIDAAEKLNRQWIGIDISPMATKLIERRLRDSYGKDLSKYEIRGAPNNEKTAIELWKYNPFAFQDWWVSEYEAFSTTQGTKGADKGIDGIAKYLVGGKGETIKAGFQVKGGKVQSKDIDALWGAMNKHNCDLGVFLSINPPTRPMMETISQAGYVEITRFKFPILQYSTLEDFFLNKKLNLPKVNITFESAKFKGKSGFKQMDF